MVEKMEYYNCSSLSEHSSFKSILKNSFKLHLLVLISSCSLKFSTFLNFNAIFGGMVLLLWMSVKVHCKLAGCCEKTFEYYKSSLDFDVRLKGLKYPKWLTMRISAFPDIAAKWLQNPEKLRFSIFCRHNTDSSAKGLKIEKAEIKDLRFFRYLSHFGLKWPKHPKKLKFSKLIQQTPHYKAKKTWSIAAWAPNYFSAIFIFYYHIIYCNLFIDWLQHHAGKNNIYMHTIYTAI